MGCLPRAPRGSGRARPSQRGCAVYEAGFVNSRPTPVDLAVVRVGPERSPRHRPPSRAASTAGAGTRARFRLRVAPGFSGAQEHRQRLRRLHLGEVEPETVDYAVEVARPLQCCTALRRPVVLVVPEASAAPACRSRLSRRRQGGPGCPRRGCPARGTCSGIACRLPLQLVLVKPCQPRRPRTTCMDVASRSATQPDPPKTSGGRCAACSCTTRSRSRTATSRRPADNASDSEQRPAT